VKNSARIKAFGTHLRRLREKEEMSQQQLADTADVAKITIQRIENAKYSATLDMLITLSKALKIPLKELLDF
jgi:DNA-binding XRE family transcriptional regulator